MNINPILRAVSAYTLAFGLVTSANSAVVDWSTVALDGVFPSFSFTDSTLGNVTVEYTPNTEWYGIQSDFGGIDALAIGQTGGESFTISWTNSIQNMIFPIWDVDAIPGTTGESVTLSTSATVSVVSLHATDTWNAGTNTLGNDGTANSNSSLDNYTILSLSDSGGFNSFTLNFSLDAGTGGVSVGNIQTVPIPAAVWLFSSGLIGLIGVARRRKT